MLIINFKNYSQALGEQGVRLAKDLEEAASEFPDVEVILAISPVDVFRISQAVKLPIFSQHVDPFETGQTTGWVIPEAVKAAGAVGALINHSERPMAPEMAADAVVRCLEVGLKPVVCAASVEEIGEIKGRLGEDRGPDFYAYEPPELIGGDVSVVEAEPGIVSEAVKISSPIPLLVGAGVHSSEDVEAALKLGAVGVLVSSDIVTAEDPVSEFRDIAEGFSSTSPRE